MKEKQISKEERERINSMFDRAEDKRDYPGEYFPLLDAAKNALADWREKYPEEAKIEDAEREIRKIKKQLNILAGSEAFWLRDYSEYPDSQREKDEAETKTLQVRLAELEALLPQSEPELAPSEAKLNSLFFSAEETTRLRQIWNSWVRSYRKMPPAKAIIAKQEEMGFTFAELKSAIAHYGL
jgi:hypothetical protein